MVLKIELLPSSIARRLLFFMVARLIVGVAALFVLFFVHLLWGLLLFAAWLLLTVGYYFYLHRLALAVFLLASKAAETVQGQPVGRAAPSPETIT